MTKEPTPPSYVGSRIRWNYLKKYLPRSEGGYLLDAGCGQCEFKELVESRGYKYFGIDNDPNSSADKGDLCALPYKDKYFDSIIVIDVLEHIQDDFKAVKELWRVLKPDGILIVHVPNQNQKHILIEPEEQHDHVRHGYTPASLYTLFNPEFRKHNYYPTFNEIESICWDITWAGNHNKPINPSDLIDLEKWKGWINYGWICVVRK